MRGGGDIVSSPSPLALLHIVPYCILYPLIRYEKLAEQEELSYQQQRRKLFAEVAQEKEKVADQFQRQKATFDLQLKENTELHDR